MNRICLLFFCLFSVGEIYSQQANFVYLQTEPAQPFQVKMNGNSYTSSQSGYLILSKLIDTAYQVEVVFPAEKWPTQFFHLSVNQSDRGYLLKDFGDKGWGLMDWRSLKVQYSKKPIEISVAQNRAVEDSSDFATLLSLAAGDPSLRARSEVVKDTVQKKSITPPIITSPIITPTTDVVKIDSVKQPKLSEPEKVIQIDQTIPISTTITNPRCKNIPVQELVDSIARTLVALPSDTKRLLSMSKHFQENCFTVLQIKQFCSVFKTEESKYDFLLEAWLYVTDRTHFEKLEIVFTNEELAQRFKAMIQ